MQKKSVMLSLFLLSELNISKLKVISGKLLPLSLLMVAIDVDAVFAKILPQDQGNR